MSAGRKNNANKKDWNTPPKYIVPITEFFNGIELDPCSNKYSLVKSKYNFILPETNGLSQDWNYKTVFVNPPYGRDNGLSIFNWLEKGLGSYKKFNSELIFLIPVATNTKHFKELIFKQYTSICFLSDTRLKFYNGGKEDKKGAPMACCLVYLGNRKDDFMIKFSEFGKVFHI